MDILERPLLPRPLSPPINVSRSVITLAWLVAVLALATAAFGLLWPDGGGGPGFATVRGQTVETYGRGLYQYDSLFGGSGNKGTDFVSLFVALPLLVFSIMLYRRNSLRGGLFLTGMLPYFLYIGASYALGAVAFNDLFLLYVALLATSLFGFVLMFRSIDVGTLAGYFSDPMPRRGPAWFMISSGLLTLVVWLIDPLMSLLNGVPPERLGNATTLFTNALDMAIIVPTTLLAGRLILRRQPMGYLLAISLLFLEALLAPMITAQTISQVQAGVVFTTGEMIGPIAGFGVIALGAIWVIVGLFRNIALPQRS